MVVELEFISKHFAPFLLLLGGSNLNFHNVSLDLVNGRCSDGGKVFFNGLVLLGQVRCPRHYVLELEGKERERRLLMDCCPR